MNEYENLMQLQNNMENYKVVVTALSKESFADYSVIIMEGNS